MDKSLIKSFEKNDKEAVMKMLNKGDLSQVFKSFKQAAIGGKKAAVSILQAIFWGSELNNGECERLYLDAYKYAVSVLKSTNLTSVMAGEIVTELTRATSKLSTTSLIRVANMLVELIKECTAPGAKWVQVVPVVLTTLASRDSVVYDGNELSGSDFKSQIVNAICCSRWDPTCASEFGSMLSEIPLSQQEVDHLLDKLLKTLSCVGMHEIPPLVYQLLLLTPKGLLNQIILGILQFFINQDNKLRSSSHVEENRYSDDIVESREDLETIRRIEGTAMIHFVGYASQDHNFGNGFIKVIKSLQHNAEFVLAPFTFSVALSLAKIQCYEEQIMDTLKGAVLRAFKQQEKMNQSCWMRSIFPHDLDPFLLVSEAIRSSKYDWDHVTQGLVTFGFALLDGFGPKVPFGRISTKNTAFVSDQACALGAHILRETFKIHYSVRGKIFEEILNHISRKSSKPVLHYIDILSKTARSAPQLLLEIFARLMDIISDLPCLHYANAVGMLQSISPLLKISLPLKDALMIVLRKALFRKEIEAKKIAVSGLLVLLKNLNIVGNVSLSQSQNSQTSTAGTANSRQADVYSQRNKLSSEAACLEILGTLKRALMHQEEVQQLLYEGLYSAVVKNNRMADVVLALLLNQFEKLYDPSESCMQPLKLNLCFQTEKNNVVVQEPVASLFTAIHLCLAEGKNKHNFNDSDYEDTDSQQSSRTVIEASLQTLSEKLLQCEAEDFELDKASDFNKENVVGAKNKLTVTLVLGVYETLMEYTRGKYSNYSIEMCEEILSLHGKYLSIFNVTQEKKQNKASKLKKEVKNSNTHLTVRFLSDIVCALFCDDGDSENQNGISLLRANKEFVEYILLACNQKLASYKETGKLGGFCSSMQKKFEYLCKIGRTYFKGYVEGCRGTNESSQQLGGFSFYFIEGLNMLFSVIYTDFSHIALKFLEQLDDNLDSDSDLTENVLEKFKSLTISLLSNTASDNVNLKNLSPLLSIIQCLLEHLPPNSPCQSATFSWIKQLCTDQSIKDPVQSKSLLTLFLNTMFKMEDSVTILEDLAVDIHNHIRDIEKEADDSFETKYEVINGKTAVSAFSILLLYAKRALDEVDWVLNVMKSRIIASTQPCEELQKDVCDREDIETKICLRLEHIITILSKILRCLVPKDHLSNNVISLITICYNILGDAANYFLSVFKYKIGTMNSKFQKSVKLSGTQLTPQVYIFIHYLQSSDGASAKSKTSVQKARREIKTFSSLIYAIEIYEKLLIQLSKKAKTDLMVHMKFSTARDFRIQPERVTAVEQQQSDSDANDAEDAENVNPSHTTANVSLNASSSRRQTEANQDLANNVPKNVSQLKQGKKRSSNVMEPSLSAHTSSRQTQATEERESQLSTSKLSLSRTKKLKRGK